MRGVRVREMLLVVALVALGLGWGIDRIRLVEVHRQAILATRAQLKAGRDREKALLRMVGREGSRRKRAEAALAVCEGQADGR